MSGRFVHGLGKQVNLAARLNSLREGLAIHFKVFDVDDPFDQLHAAMADVSLIDNDASGPDNRLPGGGDEEGQFRFGFVELRDFNGNVIVTKRIVEYKTDKGVLEDIDVKDEVTINIPDCGGQSGLACLGGVTGGTAVLSDDDLSDEATFLAKTWGCDDLYSGPVASLSSPDLSMMALRYEPGYILPLQDTQASAVQGLVTLVRNWQESQDNGKALWDQCLAARNLPVSTADFWTVMVVSAWQAEENTDADPDSEDQVGNGVTKGVNTHPEDFLGNTATRSNITGIRDYTGVCAVFKAIFGETTFTDYEKYTVVHEVGHIFGLDHREGGAMCAKGDCQREPFLAVELKELREYIQP